MLAQQEGNNDHLPRRKPMQRGKTIFTVFFVCLFLSVAAAAPTVTFTFTDVHATKTALETDTYGLNNEGAIVGDYVDSASVQHAMILAGTKLTKVDNPSCSSTPSPSGLALWDINSAGVAVGWCTSTSSTQIGFKYAKGKFTNVTIAGASAVNVNGINDKGHLVGMYVDSASVQHGFLLVGKTLTTLNPPKVTAGTVAFGINNNDVIAIYGVNSSSSTVSYTTADKGKTYKAVHAPGEGPLGTAIHRINNKGDIVGTYYDTAGVTHGFLYHNGKYHSFDDPKAADTRGDGLNDTLVIVGRYGTTGPDGGIGFKATTKF
jgi:probable HAF family extracellular repeat protein